MIKINLWVYLITSIYFSLLKKILSVIGNSNIVIVFVGFQLSGKVNIPSSKLLDQTLKKTKKKKLSRKKNLNWLYSIEIFLKRRTGNRQKATDGHRKMRKKRNSYKTWGLSVTLLQFTYFIFPCFIFSPPWPLSVSSLSNIHSIVCTAIFATSRSMVKLQVFGLCE